MGSWSWVLLTSDLQTFRDRYWKIEGTMTSTLSMRDTSLHFFHLFKLSECKACVYIVQNNDQWWVRAYFLVTFFRHIDITCPNGFQQRPFYWCQDSEQGNMVVPLHQDALALVKLSFTFCRLVPSPREPAKKFCNWCIYEVTIWVYCNDRGKTNRHSQIA